MAGTIEYKPNQQQADADSQAMAGMQFPEIADIDLDDYEQYASLISPVSNPIKKFIKSTLSHKGDSKSSIEGFKPRETTGKGLETPKEKKQAQMFQEGLSELVEPEEGSGVSYTPDSPEMSTDEMSDVINRNTYIAYDKDNKPSYMPRSDSKASYKLDLLEDDEDVDSAVQAMAKEFSAEIDEARRGVVTDAEAKGLAHDLSVSPEQLQKILTKPDGSTANVEEVFAMRSLMDQSAKRLTLLSAKVADNSASPEQRAEFDKAFLFHKDLLAKFMAYRAEAGRSMRAYGVNLGGGFNGPDEQQQMMDMAMAGYDSRKVANAIQLTGGDVKGVNKSIDALSNIRKGMDVLTTSFVYSILSGVQTQVVNVLGGTVQIGQSVFDRYFTEGGTRMRILFGRNVEGLMAPGESAVYRMSLQASIRQSVAIGAKSLRTGENYGGVGKFELQQDPFTPSYWGMDPNTPQAKLLTIWGNGTGFMVRNVMGASDGFFKSMSENAEYMALAYRKAWHDAQLMKKEGEIGSDDLPTEIQKRFEDYVQNPTADMHIQAKTHGKEMTYQNPTEFGKVWQKMNEVAPPLKFFTPFVNTPVSIVKQHLVDRSPLALVFNRGVLYSNTAEGQMARTKLASGLTMMAGFYMLHEDGLITGSTPSDPKERAYWEANGIQPNSIVVPHEDGSKTYISLHRMENLSYISSMVADLNTMYNQKEIDWEIQDTPEGEKAMEVVALTLVAMMKSMQDKTFLQGVNNLMSITGGRSSDSQIKNMKRIGSNILVPTLIPLSSMQRDVNTWFVDDKKKDTKELYDRFSDAMVYLKKNAPNRRDIWGEVMLDHQRGNPVKVLNAKKDPVMDKLLKMTALTNKPPFGKMDRQVFHMDLSSREYDALTKFVRKDFRKNGLNFKAYVGKHLEQMDLDSGVNALIFQGILQKAVRKWDTDVTLAFLEENPEVKDKYLKAMDLKFKRQGKK